MPTRVRPELGWPFAAPQPENAAGAIQAYIAEKGGLGDAGAALAKALDGDLGQEVELLQVKITDLDAGGQSIGDLTISIRVAWLNPIQQRAPTPWL
jgi:hypothetical protein